MNYKIETSVGNYESAYFLEELDSGISVKIPYLCKNSISSDEQENIIKYNIVDVEEGKKANFIRMFFDHNSSIVTCGLDVFELEDILFDECEIPDISTIIFEEYSQ